jgi:hypothetical protein
MFRNGRSKDRPLQRVSLDFEIEMAVTRAIEFGVEDALPAAQHQFAIFDEDELAHSRENGLNVRVGIPFGMFVAGIHRDKPVECAFGVGGNIRISMFVDQDTCRCVRYVQKAYPRFYSGGVHQARNFIRDVEQLRAPFRFNVKSVHHNPKL